LATQTFLDANVLIHAFRGTSAASQAARDLIDDPAREFVASDILRLELIPKPHFNRFTAEEEFYEDYFAAAKTVVRTSPEIVTESEQTAKSHGLSAADALHVTAAKRGGVQEFFTAEGKGKPLFRVTDIAIVSLQP
jgi:predicted nucleic acid-binding protein